MLSFLFEQIWIEVDYFLLNFIATFGSVMGLQVTAGKQWIAAINTLGVWQFTSKRSESPHI